MILAKNCAKFIVYFREKEKVKKTETNKVKNQETGEEEEVSVTKEA